MKTFVLVNRLGVIAALLVATILGCKKDDNAVTTPASDVAVGSTSSLGNVLIGANGKTLYFFAPDVTGTSSCTGNCVATWPVFYKETPTLGTGLKASDFATITRTDGSKQTTFKGWPLYYYANDAKAGDVNGENVGNVWMVAKSNYAVMLASRQLVGNDGKNYTFDTKEGTGNSIFLTDSVGRTLYAYAPDKKNKNTYTKTDLSNNPTWPIFETSATVGVIPSALNKSDFTTITTVGNKIQLTYKGWPLYYFGNDQGQRGSTKGVSVPRPGVWPVVNSTSVDAPN